MIPLPTIDVLDSITIPVTCPVSWETMHGDNRTRFCDKCSQNVHDVSELTKAEAVALVTGGTKMPCLRLYKRQDGRVMTADCATRRERVWKWLDKRSAWAAAFFALVFLAGCERACQLQGKPAGAFVSPPSEHLAEQASRRNVPTNHTTSVSRMGADAKAEAPVRHETTPMH
jgi:hypothetical protein